MRTNGFKCFLIFLLILSISEKALACSSFCFQNKGRLVFGKNYDWSVQDGLIVINKRGIEKINSTRDPHPAKWTSCFGSLSFNQYGREYPLGGINEAGLIVETMWLDDTQYADPDDRAAIDNLQWVQYQLDNSETIADVIATDARIRIVGQAATLHYFVCDNTGACATIEILDKKMVAHHGRDLPVKVLTNSTYAESLSLLKKIRSDRNAQIKTDISSLSRFVRASNMIEALSPRPGKPVEEAFRILDRIAQGRYTKWAIVYDSSQRRVYFKILANPDMRFINLEAFDYSCKTPVMVLDINTQGKGDMTNQFREYSFTLNRELVENAYRKTSFTSKMPDSTLDEVARFPETLNCKGSGAIHP